MKFKKIYTEVLFMVNFVQLVLIPLKKNFLKSTIFFITSETSLKFTQNKNIKLIN